MKRLTALSALSALTALSALSAPSALSAQGISIGASRWLTSPRISEYRLGVDGWSYGPVSFRPNFQVARRGGESSGAWGGFGSDLILRATRDARPYLIGGAGLGLGRPDSLAGLGPALGLWGGLGAELLTLGPLGVQAEALYTWRARMGVSSVSLGLRAGMKIGRGGAGPTGARSAATDPPSRAALPQASPQDEEIIRRATRNPASAPSAPSAPSTLTAPSASVIATALGAMGTPYRWGGASDNGFDCSGLIQYSYAQHGIALPRTSREQARMGTELGRNLEYLLPGDILTFSADAARAGEVSHVGLYLGESRFIHSAAGGVQVSALSPSDSVGQWWWDRWVGARRVAGK